MEISDYFCYISYYILQLAINNADIIRNKKADYQLIFNNTNLHKKVVHFQQIVVRLMERME